MFELAKVGGYLLSPLTLALGLWLAAGLCYALRRRSLAVGLASIAFVGLWVASTPLLAQALLGNLQSRYPAMAAQSAPSADAIVVLGGALAGAYPPQRPTYTLGPSANRVWFAAELYRAGKAKWVVVAAGNQPDDEGVQVEAEAIAEMLGLIGVPKTAIRLEGSSRTTWENAANVRKVLENLRVRRVLLVTSAQHMPRAVKTFAKVWGPDASVQIVPMSTDVIVLGHGTDPKMWLPSLGALQSVSKAIKEFAGLAALGIM